MGMLAPLLCAAGLYWFARKSQLSYPQSFLAAALAWGVLTLAITELLSAFRALSWAGLVIAWMTATLCVVLSGLHASAREPHSCARAESQRRGHTGQGIAVIFLVAFLGLIGICSAPVNSDSMAYHLPRVMHWMAHHSVRHYATGNVTQLYHSPWAEFAMLHFQILTDGDRFASSVQWMALIVCLVGVHVLTGQIAGGATKAQWLAVIFALTIPNAILQAVSTQNNLVVSAWLIVSMVVLQAFRRSLRARFRSKTRTTLLAAGFGAAVGLAILTKGTAYLYAIPLVGWFAAINLRYARRSSVRMIVVAGLLAASLNACHWTRNLMWCRSPLMPADQARIFHTQQIGPKLIAANAIDNIAVELRTGVPFVDYLPWRVAVSLQRAFGVAGNDPRITLPGHSLKIMQTNGSNEDTAGNPIHFLVLTCVLAIVIPRGVRRERRDDSFALAVVVLVGFVLFCTLIRWQMFHCRLHLPLLLLAAPVVAITCSRVCKRRHIRAVSAALLVLAAFTIAFNPGHPLFGSRSIFITSRESQYFTLRPTLYAPYKKAADLLSDRHCNSLGITSGPVWEYPLWVMLHNRQGSWPHIQSITPDLPLPDGPAPDPSAFGAVIVLPRRHGYEDSDPPPLGWPTQQLGHGVKLMLKP